MAEPSSPPQAIRPLGKLETYSASRHALGIYRCVTVSARYVNPPSPPSAADAAIFRALGQLVLRHPMLRVGIRGEDTNTPEFVSVPSLDLQDHVTFRSLPADEHYETGVSDVHAWCHDQLWPDVETRPPWGVVVVRPDANAGNPEFNFEDIVFSFHHSLMDGTSAKHFHEQLLTALNQPNQDQQPTHVLKFSSPPLLPAPQEALLNYTTSAFFMGRVLWGELAPSFLKPAKPAIWEGKPIDFARPHAARVLAVDIPAAVVPSLLAVTRKHSASITALLHALCLASLSRRLPAQDAPGFKASTPINARAYLADDAVDKDTFRIAISVATHEFLSAPLAALRAPDADLDALIWRHAAASKSDFNARLATLPADDPISLLSYVTDWKTFWAKKQGQSRDYSWEVSNLGTLSTPEGGPRSIARALFTNGIMVAGGPMSVSVVSVPEGPLTASITWNEDVVPEELMKGLAEDLSAYTTRMHETGKFTA